MIAGIGARIRAFLKKYGWHTFIGVAVIAIAGYSTYQYRRSTELANTRFTTLEAQINTLRTSLEQSGALTAEDAAKIQELSNRSIAGTKSQDDLLTTTVAKAAPAVVSIVISKDVPKLEVTYVNPFGDDPNFSDVPIRIPQYRQVGTQNEQIGAGSGFIIRQDGYIITNKHVVDTPGASYTVLLSNGTKKPATVIYRDPTEDVAIVRIDGSDYPTIPLGDSSSVKLGQTVAAIGNALGEYNNSVSVGIISGLNRTIQAQDDSGNVETLTGVIQTDAAINPGNSGGPLLDLDGNAIGVNSALANANSIGFAIPISEIKAIIAKVL
ncbi:MAG TPA: trypsin-like peptidase domain-containing protein [Candidatus Paceibacterota bacterium]|nr:trypsin-like peptidase domain-containing protein [Candidatus Paceibacterota bacterium]